MTNEEARKNLEKLLFIYDDGMIDFSEIRESIKMAIKALNRSEIPNSCHDAEFWRNRAKEYEKMVGELIADMSRGVKFESIQINEEGIVFKKKEPSVQTKRMTNKEWIDFLVEQFNISRTSAREMLHGMMQWKREDNFKKQFCGKEGGA